MRPLCSAEMTLDLNPCVVLCGILHTQQQPMCTIQGDNIRTAMEADRFVSSLRFSGMTPLGTQ